MKTTHDKNAIERTICSLLLTNVSPTKENVELRIKDFIQPEKAEWFETRDRDVIVKSIEVSKSLYPEFY